MILTGLVRPRDGSAAGEGTDREDLAACSSGSPDALERLYWRYAGACLALSRDILHDEHLARKAVLETFLQLWREASDIDPERTSIGAWLALWTRHRATVGLESEARIG